MALNYLRFDILGLLESKSSSLDQLTVDVLGDATVGSGGSRGDFDLALGEGSEEGGSGGGSFGEESAEHVKILV